MSNTLLGLIIKSNENIKILISSEASNSCESDKLRLLYAYDSSFSYYFLALCYDTLQNLEDSVLQCLCLVPPSEEFYLIIHEATIAHSHVALISLWPKVFYYRQKLTCAQL